MLDHYTSHACFAVCLLLRIVMSRFGRQGNILLSNRERISTAKLRTGLSQVLGVHCIVNLLYNRNTFKFIVEMGMGNGEVKVASYCAK